jgi:2-polyprenyl-6-hydroxyphenyl methylase/3-demethylubiquinone-9 3-methyltransferase
MSISEAGEFRFKFGENWSNFLKIIDDGRIAAAESSLKELFETGDMRGMTFLDAGCGSGLFSLAATRLGAKTVSFDFDPQSVACTEELKRRYFSGPGWKIEKGDALDAAYIAGLGKFDFVYSWGVLHHTGSMYRGIDNICLAVKPGGKLCLAIYNDQGGASRRWRFVKKTYCSSSPALRKPLLLAVGAYFALQSFTAAIVNMRNPLAAHGPARGMSRKYDLVDWVGGYPFEVAKPDEIFDFCKKRGFSLERLATNGGGSGCNEFVFKKMQ